MKQKDDVNNLTLQQICLGILEIIDNGGEP